MLLLERIRTIAILCLSVFGCTGNILTLIVVNQRFFRKTASSAFISGLSIADFIVLFLNSLQILTKFHPLVTSYDCIVFYFIDVFRLLSIWIVCFINIERCSLVFNPCHLPRLTSRIKSRLLVILLFILSLIIFSHYAQHMHIEYINNTNQTNPIRSFCVFKKEFNRFTWETIRSAITYWFSVPLCIICNIIIIKCFYHASRIERTFNNNSTNRLYLSTKQRQLTGMLLASSICFVLTATPSTIHTIYILLSNNLSNYQYVIHIIANILLHFHHASNFLIFIFSCVRFRTEFISLFRTFLRCQIYRKWHKRSTANTEQYFVYSTKQGKTPIKLLTQKTNVQRRSQPNDIILIALKDTHKNYKRNYGHCMTNIRR